jgi:hypothetical protein
MEKEKVSPDNACEEEYNKFKKRYSLPDFEFMQKEFDIAEFETHFVLKEIREKIKDKFDYASKIIETLFQPEGDFSSFVETKHFENGVKDDYFIVYKKLRSLVREAQILSMRNEDELDAKYINDALKSWKEMKITIIDLLEKLKSCWTDVASKDDVKYFG